MPPLQEIKSRHSGKNYSNKIQPIFFLFILRTLKYSCFFPEASITIIYLWDVNTKTGPEAVKEVSPSMLVLLIDGLLFNKKKKKTK